MSDKITVNELKIFVGTGLVFECEDDDHKMYYEKINHMHDTGQIESEDGCIYDIDDIGTSMCLPIVKPLSTLSNEDLISADAIKAKPGDEIQWDLLRGVFALAVHEGATSFNGMLYLTAKHYDVFNWIGRGVARAPE